MKFFYDIKFKNNTSLGGHNCENFALKEHYLILDGYDEWGHETTPWRGIYDLNDIVHFKFIVDDKSEVSYE